MRTMAEHSLGGFHSPRRPRGRPSRISHTTRARAPLIPAKGGGLAYRRRDGTRGEGPPVGPSEHSHQARSVGWRGPAVVGTRTTPKPETSLSPRTRGNRFREAESGTQQALQLHSIHAYPLIYIHIYMYMYIYILYIYMY